MSKHKQAAVALIARSLVPVLFTRQDRFGHYKTPAGVFRLKMQAISVRFERKTASGWFCVRSYYYKDLDANAVTAIADRVNRYNTKSGSNS